MIKDKYIEPQRKDWETLCKRPTLNTADTELLVNEIFTAVKNDGDVAVKRYTQQFGDISNNLKIAEEKINDSASLIDPELKAAIDLAYKNLNTYHQLQVRKTLEVETMPGIKCSTRYVAVEQVALYIPGGTAPLFSTVLMLGVPAQLAGCTEACLFTPVKSGQEIHPAILYAARLCRIKNIYTIGGIQAVAACCFGTETIPKANKIFGPGNQYVAAAKKKALDFGMAADLPAGPSEVLVIGDDTAIPEFLAADLLAQAEHGPDSQVMLVVTAEEILEKVNSCLQEQLQILPRANFAIQALANSKAFVFKNTEDAIRFSNCYAPEHLIISTKDCEELSDKIINAGSVFLGNYTPESLGDYASGTNHTLPTNGFARNYSGVSVYDFQKSISFQQATISGLGNLGPAVEIMAKAEQLQGHANAVRVRLSQNKT